MYSLLRRARLSLLPRGGPQASKGLSLGEDAVWKWIAKLFHIKVLRRLYFRRIDKNSDFFERLGLAPVDRRKRCSILAQLQRFGSGKIKRASQRPSGRWLARSGAESTR